MANKTSVKNGKHTLSHTIRPVIELTALAKLWAALFANLKTKHIEQSKIARKRTLQSYILTNLMYQLYVQK